IPGSANLPLYKALHGSKIRHILARHEQGAGFIAQGMARSTGKAAVCFATSGPGTTNLITAIADAKLDSVPVVAFTGQVASSSMGTDAFQEIDTYGLTIPITKHNFLVRSTRELPEIIIEAFHIAESGRPGPVVIDIPKDVQTEVCFIESWPEFKTPEKYDSIEDENIDEIVKTINEAQKPLLFVGAGIIESKAEKLLYQLATKNNIPVTSTLRGLGCFPPSHPLYLGMIGMHGTKYANQLMEEADVVIALGVRFDDRATGKLNEFCQNATLIHVDIDKSEINKLKMAHISIHANVKEVILRILPGIAENNRAGWLHEAELKKGELPYVEAPENGDPFHPLRIINEVARVVPEDTIITTDVGQHQMWVAMKYPFSAPRTFLTSGGLGTMGFGVPVAIGAALANPEKKVVCFSGDGSFLMNIQELATIAEQKCNIAILIFNNGYLGLVRQQQELFFDQKYVGSQFHAIPDFAGIAKNFGISSVDLEKSEHPLDDLEQALHVVGPVLINVPIHYSENVFPMVPPGGANKTMIDKFNN
ncbi:MAG: biosynthetic-type acetolactate synthase large subunit, partial [Mariniphaga sp.]